MIRALTLWQIRRRAMHTGPFHDRISQIEVSSGSLSSFQILLLLTDGSVTTLLEAITGDEVIVKTLSQTVIPADEPIASLLAVRPGAAVNYRVVDLKNRRTGEVLISAISHTPLERLEPGFKDDLMRADIPIGKILKLHNIEARREISDIQAFSADASIATRFGVTAGTPFLSRNYLIIRHDKPFMAIEEMFPISSFTQAPRVEVRTPSRLHMGLIDLHGGLGRVDGGIGIALDGPRTVIEAEKSPTLRIHGGNEEQAGRISEAAEAVLSQVGITGSVAVHLREIPAEHTGLGTGTALSLATARAVCELYGISIPISQLAQIVGRGGTSGIGTAAFRSGGFIVDGGHRFGKDGEKQDFRPSSASRGIQPPPVLVRYPFPLDWKILLVLPATGTGVSGTLEQDIFREVCPVSRDEVQEICHEIMMRMLPGIVEHDIGLFSAAVNRIQELGFKKAEIKRQTAIVHQLLAGLREAGAACSGMSSFGPAVYAVADADTADLEQAAKDLLGDTPGQIIMTRADNWGADIRWI
jgi:beta-ribofuranosylaminobenzene 5'-phosphate synthase